MGLRRLAVFVLVLAACGGSPEVVDTSAPASGGTQVVTGSGGARVELPSDAPDLDVSVDSIESLEGVFPTGDPAAFAGGVVLEPHGAVFDDPVTVTIPLTSELEPGRRLRMYYWDGEGTAWEETSFFATVEPDGMTAVGEVTHFSYYILQPSGLQLEEDGIFGNVDGMVLEEGRSGYDAETVTPYVIQYAFEHLARRFPLGEEVPLHVPIVNGYNCYAPVGIFMVFDHGTPGVERPLTIEVGDLEDVEFRIDYLREVDVSYVHGGVQAEVVGTLTANVYWKSQPPEMGVSVSDRRLWGGESSTIDVELSCGGYPMVELEVDFEVLGDVSGVDLSQTLGFTNHAGLTSTVVSTEEDAGGLVEVRVDHLWTDQPGDNSFYLTEIVELGIGGLTGPWEITGQETWSNCTNEEDNGTWSGSGDVTFYQEGETFTGTGTFPRTTDVIVGTVTRTGEDEFRVSGSTNYTEDWSDCDANGCFEWTVRGTARFSGVGSVATETIDFEWQGADRSGDTCRFRGEGVGTRK